MRVMTYNIRHGQGEDGWVSNARIAHVVREADVDIVGLNEVWRLGSFFDQPAALRRHLEAEHAFERNTGFAFYEQGNLVLTRHCIVNVENIPLPSVLEQRGCLVVHVDVAGEEVAFASVHLSLGRAIRARQIEALAEKLPRDVPLVLAGDMNCTANELGPLGQLLTLADVPPSYPAFWPRRALDHIGFSKHWSIEHVHSIKSSASDHRPVVAELVRCT
jgi:endonuclease/exonuclease/phosphatase family metal-dependent hydrolase